MNSNVFVEGKNYVLYINLLFMYPQEKAVL